MSEKTSSPVGVGVLTIFTVLLVLTLALFSVLTYTAARSDLALAQRSAETTSAYYRADAEARRQRDAFLAGSAPAYEAAIPMTDAQSLYISLVRTSAGACEILAWKTIPAEAEAELPEAPLPVWDGQLDLDESSRR